MLSAIRIATDLAGGRTTPDDVLDRVGGAIAEREPTIGAFTAYDLAAARAAASAAQGPLRGVPFAAKDNLDTRDFATAYGSPIYDGHRPAEDAASVTMARQAGAALIGKAELAEFALFAGPRTRNPHDLARTPGGSSSGSAAAVAAGMVAFAFGTQTAGSVIRPAAFCGVAGYKPSFGRLPMAGVKLVAPSLDTVGLFAASIADAVFVMASLTGREPPAGHSGGPLRIGVVPGWAGLQASDAMLAAVDRAARAAERAGAAVRSVVLPAAAGAAHDAQSAVMGYEAVRALAPEFDAHRSALSGRLSAYLEESRAITEADYRQALATAETARAAMADVFGDVDVLLAPAAPGAAPEGLAETGSSTFNRLWTLLRFPTATVPGLTTDGGLPLGVQIIGPALPDDLMLGAADFVERAIARGP